MLNNKRSKKLVYKRFFISYILILVLPITLGSFVYYKALDVIEKDAYDARIFMLKQASIFMDNYFKDVEKVVINMSLDSRLQNILYMNRPDYGTSDIYNINDVQKSLGTYSFSTSFSSSFYVFLKQSDLAFEHNSNQQTVHFGIKNFYENYIQYDGMQYEEWNNRILNHSHFKEVFPACDMRARNEWSAPVNNIAYVQSIPLGHNNNPAGAIEVLINTSGIKKLLSDVDESKKGWTYILDQNGKLITGVSNGKKNFPIVSINKDKATEYRYENIDGVNMAVLNIRSSYNNWAYVTILPVDTVMVKANHIKTIILIIVGISLLVGLTISFILAKKNVKPITEVIHTLRAFFKDEMEKGRNEYDFLKNGISRLINVNEDMTVTVNNQAILLKSSFLRRLIKGEFNDEKEIDMQRNHLELKLEGQWFSAVIVNLQAQTELKIREQLIEQDIYRLIFENILYKHIEKEGYVYILNSTQIVVILSSDIRNRTECLQWMKTLIETIRNELIESYNIFVNFYVGSPYDRLIDISLSYNEATSLLDHFNGETVDRDIIWYWEERLENTLYFYPLEIEQKLINMATAGNSEEVLRVLDMIYKENFENRILTNYMEYHLLFDMRGTIFKSLERVKTDLNVKELISNKYSGVQPKEIFKTISNIYMVICDTSSNIKKNNKASLFDKLVLFIKSRYCSPDISVSSVASEFNVSESYLSKFFKEQTGETFSDYIEKLRIDHACELLKDQSVSVEEVSCLVGYNSAYSFRRAFKRVTGVVPSQYKQCI